MGQAAGSDDAGGPVLLQFVPSPAGGDLVVRDGSGARGAVRIGQVKP
ncbi:hypothetical protein [Streptomyces flaveolus]